MGQVYMGMIPLIIMGMQPMHCIQIQCISMMQERDSIKEMRVMYMIVIPC